ncbi:MAG: tRNA epoxyqueuosine(34) reductase QueG [Sedimentisphaerales bacterium]|nr:tRNA epoxyqueuosine(34) reductase QueG [Sedimentisphaerales bacterium]
MTLSQEIKHKAIEFGFDLIGITDASPIDNRHIKLLSHWLKSGLAGQMGYLHKNFEKRTHPALLLEKAQSVICVGLNYKPPKQNSKQSGPTVPMGKVASYAQYEDYHPFIKERLRKLTEFISSAGEGQHKFKICVDSVPLAERSLAYKAGLGFIGKNRMLINPALGPQIFLGEIITTLKLPTDNPITYNCSNCDNCIKACPTHALTLDEQFDANKCINYLTIEYKGLIPSEMAKKTGDRIFGCNECIIACPYQKNAPVCKNKQFKLYKNRVKLDLSWILNLTQQDFDAEFADSTIKRSGLDRLKKNAQICLDNINRYS